MTASDLERRVAELEAIVERRIEGSDTNGTSDGVSRRSLLHGLGLLGLGSYAVGSASADAQGQLGSSDRPVRTVYAQRLAGGLTGGTPITSLLGSGLSIDSEALSADVADATSTGDGASVFTGFDGNALQFRTIEAGSNVSLSTGNGELTIDASSGGSGESNTASNVGTGTGVFKRKAGTDLEFKSLIAGSNLSISSGTDTLTLAAAASGTDVSDDGTTVVSGTGGIDFRNSLSVTDDGDGTVTADVSLSIADILQNSATDGQVITWDGSAWKTAFPGTTGDTAFDLLAGGTRALRLVPDSSSQAVNIVGGHPSNVANGWAATIGGGGVDANGNGNVVYDNGGTIGGGKGNQAGSNDSDSTTGREATVAGGYVNTASGGKSAVGGGIKNTASGAKSVIAGGNGNLASANEATVAGGLTNEASGNQSTVGGGKNNVVSNLMSFIGAGESNSVSGKWSTVGGGYYNEIAANYATIAGGGPVDTTSPSSTNNAVYDNYGTIAGGGGNRAGSNDATDAIYASVGGGYRNSASGQDSTVGGGSSNTASGYRSTVAAGHANTAKGQGATVGGGADSNSFDDYATVAGGRNNIAGSNDNDTATAKYATVGGGYKNEASGTRSTVPGGYGNTASGNYGFAAGRRAKAKSAGTFVWADSQSTDFSSDATMNGSGVTGSDTFHVQSQNGARFVVGSSTSYISSGTGGWTNTSTREAKTNFQSIDTRDVLDGVRSLDITTWEYKDDDGDGAGITHMGPVAEEFHEAFTLGDSDRHINSINADGVAFAAIQGLAERVDRLESDLEAKDQCIDDLESDFEEKDERIDRLETELEEKDERIDRLEARLEDVERALGGGE